MASSKEEKICVIHIVETAGSDKIKLFDDEKFPKCRNAQLVSQMQKHHDLLNQAIPTCWRRYNLEQSEEASHLAH
ncbi:hypothetical protein OUZ56_005613 [Daphnia magna]|uniref:Uncharacterized protein n=1 Tax=Daphnia magna TaxID=35525 RepID=A0ABQ9YT88_9CRUS|nr:hypothetical protein OUZ56_005613 [Daphnia magna]